MFLNISHNSREKARNATLIIDMKGPTSYIKVRNIHLRSKAIKIIINKKLAHLLKILI